MMLFWLWLIPALSFIYPLWRYMSFGSDSVPSDIAAALAATLASIGWPLWVLLVLRRALLEQIIGEAK